MRTKRKKVSASEESPVMLCRTCGTATNKVIIRRGTDGSLLPSRLNGKPKTWKRTIKHDQHRKMVYQGRAVPERKVYFSYFMLDCIKKHHKLSIRKKDFSVKLCKKLV